MSARPSGTSLSWFLSKILKSSRKTSTSRTLDLLQSTSQALLGHFTILTTFQPLWKYDYLYMRQLNQPVDWCFLWPRHHSSSQSWPCSDSRRPCSHRWRMKILLCRRLSIGCTPFWFSWVCGCHNRICSIELQYLRLAANNISGTTILLLQLYFLFHT